MKTNADIWTENVLFITATEICIYFRFTFFRKEINFPTFILVHHHFYSADFYSTEKLTFILLEIFIPRTLFCKCKNDFHNSKFSQSLLFSWAAIFSHFYFSISWLLFCWLLFYGKVDFYSDDFYFTESLLLFCRLLFYWKVDVYSDDFYSDEKVLLFYSEVQFSELYSPSVRTISVAVITPTL